MPEPQVRPILPDVLKCSMRIGQGHVFSYAVANSIFAGINYLLTQSLMLMRIWHVKLFGV